jgi:aldehyde dehydrogenase (NAD+)
VSIVDIYRSMDWGPAPEGAELAQEWLDAHGRSFGHFIDGAFTEPRGSFATQNPATTAELAKVSQGSAEDVNLAVAAARRGQAVWWAKTPYERARVLYALARLVQKHSRLLAVLETLDNGKPIRETRDIDIPLVARHFYYHAGAAMSMDPAWEPVGVCGQIIPWNFPLLMLAWKIAPALAMGNAVVLKPAEYTPLTALAFAELCVQAGVPAGVVNIVTGDGETGRLIVEHPNVDKIAFTGSTDVGRIIRKATAGTEKKLSLELGGKSPFIVFEDADLDSAVEGLVDAIWFNQGQVCCAGSRLLIQESIAERAHAKIRERMEKLRVGNPLDKAVDIGAIIAPVQLERIRELVTCGCNDGAEMFQPSWACPQEGWFYPPTLLTNVAPASTVAQVEIFGPVLVSMTFRTPKEAVELANNTPFGLAASVWTENVNVALDTAAKVKAGTIWVNCTNQFDAASGFGGYRESGYGREGGGEGLLEYVKAPAAGLHAPAREAQAAGTLLEPASTSLDRTHKLYIGGKQVRPDSGYSLQYGTEEVGRGNRKDIRNAVEAALAAQPGWVAQSAHGRAQVLYYLAENLQAISPEAAELVFGIAARSDKFDGAVHQVPMRALCYTVNDPLGVVGIVCSDESPMLGLLELACGAIAMGNAVVVIPSEKDPMPAVELYRILESSDVPAGVFNIVTGLRAELVPPLAQHDAVDAIWHFGLELQRDVREWSAGNLKQVWIGTGSQAVETVFRHATQVKNVWVPFGA